MIRYRPGSDYGSTDAWMAPAPDGQYVSYDEHLAELAAFRTKARAAVEAEREATNEVTVPTTGLTPEVIRATFRVIGKRQALDALLAEVPE